MGRVGIANLPLHTGHTPRWLFNRMVKMAKSIVDSLLTEYDAQEFLNRISDPYWFQAFSCVLGFDWHSSGTTTTTCGALKIAIDPEEHGLAVAGGKGRMSRQTPRELEFLGDKLSLSESDIEELKYASRISAKVDNSLVQDGYQLYHHTFIFNAEGNWAVIQQGMNDEYARRYHWRKDAVKNFIEEPHSAICCDKVSECALDLTSRKSRETRDTSLDLVLDGPQHLSRLLDPKQLTLTEYSMPKHHPILEADITPQSLKALERAYEIQPKDYEELISLRGLGPKTIRALALISELIYGSEVSWKDPVKYSFTVGGKDGYPYPVDKKVYDDSITLLRNAIEDAKVEKKEKYMALKKLSNILADSSN